ncbi:MAG: glycosyltransferase family 2 protein [Paludibacter sp.]|nr:glycosyltransferase family 2 protein [Paludibacter sp.]
MKVSIIVSVYNEEQVLTSFYRNLIEVLLKNKYDYEILFVNDGSIDLSQKIINGFAVENINVKSIEFSRNFGHEAAMIAGIDYASGEVIICMDSDLQHPPVMIPEIYDRFKVGDVDIINMVRVEQRKNFSSGLFYKILNLITPYHLESNASDFFLISKRVAQILRQDYRERVRFLRGFIQIMGFRKTSIEYIAPERKEGKSKYSLRKLVSLSVTAVATLSKLPLKIGIYLGLISGFLSVILAIYSIIMKIIEQPVSGYTTIVVFLGIMFSIQFIILGIIGEYIGFLFDEQKKRPIYIIDTTNNLSTNQ